MALPQSITEQAGYSVNGRTDVSGVKPELVIQCCINGIIGSFPAKNQRSLDGLDSWLAEIGHALETAHSQTGRAPAPMP